MGKANVDPVELRRFAADLKRFNQDLEALVAGLKSKVNNLESTWRDQEQRKFSEAFDATIKAMTSFFVASEEHVSFLGKKANAIEAYLRQR